MADSLQVSADAVQKRTTKTQRTGATLRRKSKKHFLTQGRIRFQKIHSYREVILPKDSSLGCFFVFKEKGGRRKDYSRARTALIEALGEDAVTSLSQNPEQMRASIIEADLYLNGYEDEKSN